MTENKIESSQMAECVPEPSRLTVRSKIEILFELTVSNPKPTVYRAVKAIDGNFRMEKRGEHAQKFRSAILCGSEDCLLKFREAIEFNYGNQPRSKT